jgi:hypothetical protein
MAAWSMRVSGAPIIFGPAKVAVEASSVFAQSNAEWLFTKNASVPSVQL